MYCIICKIDKDASRQMHIPFLSSVSLFCFFSLFQSVAGAADVEGTLCYGIDYFLFLVK